MTEALLEQANLDLRQAVLRRLESAESSCCEGGRIPTAAQVVERFNPTHPTSKAFFDLCDEMKATHKSKSNDYGSPDDPLANIRNGARFVGIGIVSEDRVSLQIPEGKSKRNLS